LLLPLPVFLRCSDCGCLHPALLHSVQVGVIVVERPVGLHLVLADHADGPAFRHVTLLLRTLLDVVEQVEAA
jgi:hypothetical protein